MPRRFDALRSHLRRPKDFAHDRLDELTPARCLWRVEDRNNDLLSMNKSARVSYEVQKGSIRGRNSPLVLSHILIYYTHFITSYMPPGESAYIASLLCAFWARRLSSQVAEEVGPRTELAQVADEQWVVDPAERARQRGHARS